MIEKITLSNTNHSKEREKFIEKNSNKIYSHKTTNLMNRS